VCVCVCVCACVRACVRACVVRVCVCVCVVRACVPPEAISDFGLRNWERCFCLLHCRKAPSAVLERLNMILF